MVAAGFAKLTGTTRLASKKASLATGRPAVHKGVKKKAREAGGAWKGLR